MKNYGWAVVNGGKIDARTVCDTRRAAIVNWLVTNTEVFTDEAIERAWHTHCGDAICTTVQIKVTVTPL